MATITLKIDDKVYKEFKALDITTDDWIPLTLNSQKLMYLVNLYKKFTNH